MLGRHVPRQIRTISARQQVGHCYQLAAECRQPVKLTVDLGDVVARQLFSVLAWRLPVSQNSSKRLDLPQRNPSRCPPWMLLEPLREKRAAARSAADLILTRADEDQCDLTARLGAGGRDQLGYPETSKWSERPTPSTPDQPRSAAVPTSYRPSKPGPWPVFFPAITKQVVDLAIVPMMKIICRSKPSSWSRSGVASSRRNHHGLVSADQVRPRNALAVVRPESKIQDHHMTMILIAPTTSATTGRDVRGSTV